MGVFGKKSLKEREARLTSGVHISRALDELPTQPDVMAVRKKRPRRRRFFLLTLSLLLVVLLTLGIYLGQPAIRQWLSPAGNSASSLQRVLHPETNVTHAFGIDVTVSLFMQNMLQKNWSTLWSLLDVDAQGLWQNEQDFVHFEQTKFGALTLQSYAIGPAIVSKPWLDPDTTQVYPSATTVTVDLQAFAPSGLLTAPSNQALNQGLFQHTLFAIVQNSKQKWKVLVAGPADLEAPVLVPAKAPISHLIMPIFMYHHVSSLPTHNVLDYSLTVTAANFGTQLTWLQEQGYHAITMTDLFDTFYYGKVLPSKPMILSFDDGYTDVYTYALPLLLEHHYRGVFYIITGMIGGNYMTWDEVRTLARSGMQIASHTVHHINLGQPPAGTTTQKELVNSRAKLEAELGTPIQFFCYPTGEPFHHDTIAEQQIVLNDLFADGYLGATLDPSVFDSALQNSQIPYQLPRIRVSGGELLTEFMGILSSTLQADQARLRLLNMHS